MSIAFINNFSTTLAANLHSSGVTLPLPADAAERLDFSDGQHYLLTIAGDDRSEIVLVTEGLAIERGQEGTQPPAVWPEGTTVFCGVTAGGLQALAEGSSGGGGGSAVVVAEDAPDRPPAYPGEQWVTPYQCWIGTATDSLFDWKRTAGEALTAGWGIGPGTEHITVEPLVERLYLGASSYTPTPGPVTFVLDLNMDPTSMPEGGFRERSIVLPVHPIPGGSVTLKIPAPPTDYIWVGLDPALHDLASFDPDTRTLSIEFVEKISLEMMVSAERWEGERMFGVSVAISDYRDPFESIASFVEVEPAS